MPEPFGFLNINKPLHLTSHDVVARIRRGFKIKKVGHAGTLDPLAMGVLVVCVGGATRLSEYVMHATKQYRALVHLGATTDTYDAEGEILSERDATHITREAVEQMLTDFLGDIQQVPPMYSAIKQGGKKLYELAREGQTVEREPRNVTIESLTISEWSSPRFTLDVVCSAGTYIRSLAYDLGEKLGVGAYLAGLERTASGTFDVKNAVMLDDLLNSENPQEYLVSPNDALAHFPAIHLTAEDADHVLHGRSIPVSDSVSGQLARAYDDTGNFIAILQAEDNRWRPHKVFLPES